MRGNQGWWVGIVLSFVAACGQELVLPSESKPQKTKGAESAPEQGFTGAGGVADEASTKPRLPVAEEPIYTAFGGAGGAGDESGASGNGSTEGIGGTTGSAGRKATGSAGRSAGGMSGVAGSAVDSAGAPVGGEAGSSSAPTGPVALLFSEYVEGTGSFKALEIYAITASSLEGCELQTYSNGKLEPSRLALHGELGQGEVYVLCSSALATAKPNACNRPINLTVPLFNGDDALALSCAGQVLDVIGEMGVDPGESWGAGATLDHTLRRRCEVTGGRTTGNAPFEIDAEWLTLGADTFSDLGVRNCAP